MYTRTPQRFPLPKVMLDVIDHLLRPELTPLTALTPLPMTTTPTASAGLGPRALMSALY